MNYKNWYSIEEKTDIEKATNKLKEILILTFNQMEKKNEDNERSPHLELQIELSELD
jgi:hypothetical protein